MDGGLASHLLAVLIGAITIRQRGRLTLSVDVMGMIVQYSQREASVRVALYHSNASKLS